MQLNIIQPRTLIYVIADNYSENELQLLLLWNFGSVILWTIAAVLEDAST